MKIARKEAGVSRATMNRATDTTTQWETRVSARDSYTPREARKERRTRLPARRPDLVRDYRAGQLELLARPANPAHRRARRRPKTVPAPG